MSELQYSAQQTSAVFTPPAYDQPHVYRQIEEIVGSVTEVVSRVWPLRDYVAINPYAGIASRTFADAHAFLRIFSDCELLMPMEYYRSRHADGRLTISDVKLALSESSALTAGKDSLPTVDQVMQTLRGNSQDDPIQSPGGFGGRRPIRTIAEHADEYGEPRWVELIASEIGKFCASHYDQTEAAWKSPWRDLPLYQAWKSQARHDQNLEILGLRGFRAFVEKLPDEPLAALVSLLIRLQIPTSLWESFLLCQVFSLPGWCAWAKYQDHLDETVEGKELIGLLAIRLAHDVALAEAEQLQVHWDAMIDQQSAKFRPPQSGPFDDTAIRMVLLRAAEIRYREAFLSRLAFQPPPVSPRRLAQLVFCIDVRSERYRRQIEAQTPQIETFGFAGFFGMPIEYVELGRSSGDDNVPALIRPHFKLYEGVRDGDSQADSEVSRGRQRVRLWKQGWKAFQRSSVGCFSFVETLGLSYGFQLLARNLNLASRVPAKPSGLDSETGKRTGPTLRGLEEQGWGLKKQTDLAESMLRNLGLVEGFARLVVFCGHGSQTENNPLRAGLDCGACGGHSGESNARFAALLLNQPEIRAGLADRGVSIPRDTVFLAGLHQTTTDRLELFDIDQVPSSHQGDLHDLLDHAQAATLSTRKERMPVIGARTQEELLRRASDWSEVRPEWGLAGNAGFFVGPRWMTRSINMDGRMFMHSYDSDADPAGDVLEGIMTAPMVVTHWINMQYYASTVDNRHFGSGDKTIHNVVGGFGLLSGGGGDLMTGLPIQSLHDGRKLQHQPMRLQVFIAAPRARIGEIVRRHGAIKDLIDNGWMHLHAVEHGQCYRFDDQQWSEVEIEATPA